MTPEQALLRVIHCLDRAHESGFKAKAFTRALDVVRSTPADELAERAGYTVVDPPSIIATHLTEIIKRHAGEILGRQEVQAILDALYTHFDAVRLAPMMAQFEAGLAARKAEQFDKMAASLSGMLFWYR